MFFIQSYFSLPVTRGDLKSRELASSSKKAEKGAISNEVKNGTERLINQSIPEPGILYPEVLAAIFKPNPIEGPKHDINHVDSANLNQNQVSNNYDDDNLDPSPARLALLFPEFSMSFLDEAILYSNQDTASSSESFEDQERDFQGERSPIKYESRQNRNNFKNENEDTNFKLRRSSRLISNDEKSRHKRYKPYNKLRSILKASFNFKPKNDKTNSRIATRSRSHSGVRFAEEPSVKYF